MNSASTTKTKVLRLRLKDKHAQFLGALAREVNFVWNHCNDLQITMFNREENGLAVTAKRSMTGTSTPRRTFSRRDVAVL